MGVPTITTVTPNSGPTGGRRLVAIVGTNFQLLPEPPATGPAGDPPNPSVQVLFGDELALDVAVLSPSLLHAYTAAHDPGAVSVTVRNVDQAGDVVPGETVTAASAYTFARPSLATGAAAETDLARLVRTLLRELKRQVIENVQVTVSTDFADAPDGANVAMFSAVPGIALAGPALRENRFFSENQHRYLEVDAGVTSGQQRQAYTVDLGFTLIGVDDNLGTFLNLMSEVVAFFNRNKALRMLTDPAVAGVYSEYELELDADGAPKSIASANNSNLHAFQAQFTIRGFDIDDANMERRQVGILQDLPAGVDGTVWPVYLGGTVGPDGLALETGIRIEQKEDD